MFLFRLEHITKLFDQKKVLQDVSITFRQGCVHGIVGENGAGKSTLMHILSGAIFPTSGDIYFNDTKLHIKNPLDAITAGIGIVHQNPLLANSLTIWESCVFAATIHKSLLLSKKKHISELQIICKEWHIDLDLGRRIASLSSDERLYASLLVVLYQKPQLLILDEPTASLTTVQRASFTDFIRQATQKNMSVVFISHNLEETLRICDYITVLRNGVSVAELDIRTNSYNVLDLQKLMYGEDFKTDTTIKEKKEFSGEPLLIVQNLKAQPYIGSALNDISFFVRAGEMVLINGKRDSGLETLENILTDMYSQPYSGTVTINAKTPAIVPSNRMLRASHPDLFIYEILIPHTLNTLKTGLILSKKKRKAFATALITQEGLSISPHQKVSELSGGMLQRLILARELEQKPDLLIFIEPTYGLDIQTSKRIQKTIQEAAQNGAGVVILSTENDIDGYYDSVLYLSGGILQTEYELKQKGAVL